MGRARHAGPIRSRRRSATVGILRAHRNAGIVLLPMLGVMLAFALLLLAGWTAATSRRLEARAGEVRTAALQHARERLTRWYREHLAELDTPGGVPPDLPPSEPGPGAAGLPSFQLGALVFQDAIPARSVVYQEAGRERVLVDGHGLERSAQAAARVQLREVAARLETWFHARVADDPLHRLDLNHFRPADAGCGEAGDELPCLADYTALGGQPVLIRNLALSPEDLHSPWGDCCPIEVSNGADANPAPPYSMALRIRTPWGVAIPMLAIQPGAGA